MLKVFTGSLILLVATATAVTAAGPEPTTEEQKTFYALGYAMSQRIATFNLSEAELSMVTAGMTDGVLHRPSKVELQTYGPKLGEIERTRMTALAAEEKKATQAFLGKAAAEKGATKTPSGLIITTLRPGTGASPSPTDKVKVHYQAALTDGTVVDSSLQRGEPATLALNGVVRCWGEGVPMMKVGGKSRLICPSDLAYGDRGAPPRIKPGATLVFEIELLDIVK
jgi:FKBP-type peptidyl-prolyl cis-trans isomerase FkpA/FKBP-type peptidyl-prolyl cis-trans isomerase FklB